MRKGEMTDVTLPGHQVKLQLATDKRIELKFVIDDQLTEEVKQWARHHLGVDSHCDSRWGDSYEVNTLYLDSPDFATYHRLKGIGECKHRLRRYGNEERIWLETKRKRKSVVQKNRMAIAQEEMGRLQERIDWHQRSEKVDGRLDKPSTFHPSVSSATEQHSWCGDWFADRIAERQLQPAVMVHYRRFARMSHIGEEDLRLTIDTHLGASPVNGWTVLPRTDVANSEQTIASGSILELKFHNVLPALFKQLLQQYPISAANFSKYRTAFSACCLPADPNSPLDPDSSLDTRQAWQ
jgi:hypothetical protein